MRRRKVCRIVVMTAFAFGISSHAGGQNRRPSPPVVSFDGFSAVRIGMTVREASRALGVPLVEQDTGEGDCSFVSPQRGFKGVSFMVTGERISRVDIFGAGYATDRGAKVGDTEARIKRLYRGSVKVSEHPYVEGHYLTVESGGGKFTLIFETDGKHVTSFRAGRSLEAGYIEGCS
jgi:hypothetical protein